MRRIGLKLAAALGVAGAIVLSAASAEAQSARKKPVNPTAGQYRAYSASAYYPAPVRSGGIGYGDGRMGANYNPNQ